MAREILDYVLREMTSPEGGFYSTQDADSEGEEGKFFVWTPAEARAVLRRGAERRSPSATSTSPPRATSRARNILHRTIERPTRRGCSRKARRRWSARSARFERRLFEARERRVKPARDEKILAAWNGMMIGALAEGFRALGDERYLKAAARGADFVMTRLWDGHALKRSYKDGVARFNAYLEDYALFAGSLIDLYEASLDGRYLELARTMADVILERFLDREKGGFFFTSDDHERLITRSKAVFDGSTPSGNSAAVMALLRLHGYTGEERYFVEARRTLNLLAQLRRAAAVRVLAHARGDRSLSARRDRDRDGRRARQRPASSEWIERPGPALPAQPRAVPCRPARFGGRASCPRRCGANRRSTAS